MTKEMVIAANRHETKVAVLEDDQLVEVYFQRANEYSLAGSIHKGRVTRVLPGMQSAFVDLGLDRDTFLYVSDFFEEHEDYDRLGGTDDRSSTPADITRRDPNRERRTETFVAPKAIVEPQVTTPVVVAPPVVVEPLTPSAGVARDQDRGDRDAKGRRSRRRRRGGRGFPDSKYASEVPAEGEAAPGGE